VDSVTENERNFGPAHQRYLKLKFIRKPRIIRIDEGNEFAFCVKQANVACGVNTGVRLRDQLNSFAEAFDHGARAIARAVVHDDQLPAGIGLRQHTPDGAAH
jgi:hypothetical protein